MADEVREKLEKRKADIEKAFEVLKTTHSELSKQLSENQSKQVQLQGAYQELEFLLKSDAPEESKKKDKK